MNLANYFSTKVAPLAASPIAKAYISGLFADQATKPVDLSKESVVLTFAAAKRSHDFQVLQSIGDWVLWVDTFFPAAIAQSLEVTESIGRISYYRCSRLLPDWRVYEELGDTLPIIVPQLRAVLSTQ